MMKRLTARDYAVSAWSGGTTTQLAIFPPDAVYAHRDFLWRVSSATVDLEESDFTPLPDYERLIATLEGEITLTHKGGAPITLQPFQVHAFSGGDATHSVGRCRDFNLMLRRGRAAGTMEALHLVGAAQSSPVKGRGSAVSGAEEGFRPPEAEGHPASTVGTSIACPLPGETLLLYCAAGSCTVGAATGRPPAAEGPLTPLVGTSIACPPSPDETLLLYCAAGSCTVGAAQTSPSCQSERSVAESKNPFPSVPLHAGETLLCTDPVPLTLAGTADLMLCRIKVKNESL